MKRITIKVIGALCVLIMVSGNLFSQSLELSLFDEVNQSMLEAKRAQADVLSPRVYGDAKEEYDDAKKKFKNDGDLSEIRLKIARANVHFQRATESTKVSSVLFSGALSARTDALNAEANVFVKEKWNDAEKEMRDAAEELEKGDSNDAKQKAIVATDLYRKAELESIQANYLTSAKKLLKVADHNKVYKDAPKTIKDAKALVAKAEKELQDNRYDTDDARHLAKEAEYKANLAIYIDKEEERLDDLDFETEDFLLMSYEPLIKIGESLNLNLRFDKGVDGPVSEILGIINDDQRHMENLEASLFNYRVTNESLNSMLKEQKNVLANMKGTLSEEALKAQKRQMVLQSRIDRMAEINLKFEQVQQIFNKQEALVFRQKDDIIIRMIGVNFDISQSQIKQEDYALLTKVQQAIGTFPNASIVIEGHTDSQGGDEQNLKLSQERADAVLSYLDANTDINKARFSTKGFGESRPVANNETAAGRKLNRRIDIVIIPTFSDISLSVVQ